jgi:apolipoprotein N-acyltransferase
MKKKFCSILLSSYLLILAFSTTANTNFLVFISLPFFWLLCSEQPNKKSASFVSFCSIFCLFFFNTYYLSHNINNGWCIVIVVSLIYAIFYIPFGILVWFTMKKSYSFLWPLLWITFEHLRAYIVPFPYGKTAYVSFNWGMSQFAEYIGVTGLGIIIAYLAYIMNRVFWSLQKKRRGKAVLYLLVFFFCFISINSLGTKRKLEIQNLTNSGINVLLIQGGYPYIKESSIEVETRKSDAYLSLLQSWREKNFEKSVDVVIFPENTLSGVTMINEPLFLNFSNTTQLIPNLEFYAESLKQLKLFTPVIIGGTTSPSYESEEEYNSACYFRVSDKQDEMYKTREFYHKRKLIPFSEYVPEIKFVKDLAKMMLGYIPYLTYGSDRENKIFNIQGMKVQTLICWEVGFPQLLGKDVDFFVNISNEAWVVESTEAVRQSKIARQFRAIETRKSVVHCGNAGGSCITDPTGETIQEMPYKTPGILYLSVPLTKKSDKP